MTTTDLMLLVADVFKDLEIPYAITGKQRLKEVIQSSAAKSADQIATALKRSLADFLGDVRPQDDVTFVILKSVRK